MDDTISYIAIMIATASAGFAFWQTKEFIKQTKLAFLPSLTPRYVINQADPSFTSYLVISNVGHGSAIDIKLKITNVRENQSIDFNVYALMPKDERQTPITLTANSLWKITGTYVDTAGNTHEVEIEFEYPPKIIKFKQ